MIAQWKCAKCGSGNGPMRDVSAAVAANGAQAGNRKFGRRTVKS